MALAMAMAIATVPAIAIADPIIMIAVAALLVALRVAFVAVLASDDGSNIRAVISRGFFRLFFLTPPKKTPRPGME